jgi:hypothetical protein
MALLVGGAALLDPIAQGLADEIASGALPFSAFGFISVAMGFVPHAIGKQMPVGST